MNKGKFTNNISLYSKPLFYIVQYLLIAIGSIFFLYALYGYGIILQYDEWVGRGLYPALALAKGADLYEPFNGPLITLYGAGSALFFSPTALGSTPQTAIWIGFCLNIIGLLLTIGYLIYNLLLSSFSSRHLRIFATFGFIIIIMSIFLVEPTTQGILSIHADFPAFFFLFCALCTFHAYLKKGRSIFMWISCLMLSLSVWAKIPTLPTLLFPLLFLLIRHRFREALTFAVRQLIMLLITSFLFFLAYGFEDTIFILFKHVEHANMWGDRNTLFHGNNTWKKIGYWEAIPLLFRYFVMYLYEYWYIAMTCMLSTVCSLLPQRNHTYSDLLSILSIVYCLCLPPCLAAVAHYGSVENALLFANASGIIVLISFIFLFCSNKLSSKCLLLVIWLSAIFSTLPLIRVSKSAPQNAINSPHQQAYRYLQNGNNDIYFGWYPIAHLLSSGDILTSIEAPIHLNETLPDDFDFSFSHFPKNAKYLATGPTGYGSQVLQYYLGTLREIDSPPELSGWRLYEPVDRYD